MRWKWSAYRDYVANARVELALSALGFVSGIVIARGLGPAGRGQLAAAMMWPSLVALLVCPGLPHAFAYAVGAGWASPERLRQFASRFALGAGLPAMAGYLLLCPWLLGRQFPGEIWIPGLFALSIPLGLHSGLLLPIFQGGGSFGTWNAGRLFRGGAWTALVVLLWLTAGLDVLTLLVVQMAILAVMGGYLSLKVSIVPSRVGEGGEPPAGAIFRYGRAVYLTSIAYTVNQQMDQLLLSLWVEPAELGQYAAAVTLSGVLLLAPSAVGPILFSEMTRSSDDPSLRRRHQDRALVLVVAVLVPAALVLALAGPWVARLVYGPAFSRAGEVLRVLAPATVFLGIGITLADALRGAGRPMHSTYGFCGGMVLTMAGLVWALPRYGIWGAAWVSFAAYAVLAGIQFYFLRKWKSEEVLVASPTIP